MNGTRFRSSSVFSLSLIALAAERRQHVGEQPCGMQFRLRLHGEADGAVEILAREIDAPLRRRHAHFDLGMLGLEAMQARRQPAQREGRDQADVERAGVGLAADPLQRVGHAVEGIAQVGQQRLAFAGDLEPARTAHEQRHAQPLLERLHLVADRRLGDVQLLGGVGEAGVTGGGFEGAERVQRQLRAAHLRQPTCIVFLGLPRAFILCENALPYANRAQKRGATRQSGRVASNGAKSCRPCPACGKSPARQALSFSFGRAVALLAGGVVVGIEDVMTRAELARSRRQLAQLDERLLRDIGLDRATARFEATKGFWA